MIAAAVLAAAALSAPPPDASAKCAADEEIVVCATGGHGQAETVTTYTAHLGRRLHTAPVPEAEFPTEVRFEKLFSDRRPQIVVLSASGGRNEVADVFSRELDLLAVSTMYWGFLYADLDGDGVAEIIDSGCCDRRPCGMGISIDVQHFDGKKYRPAEQYLDAHMFALNDRAEWTLALPKGNSSFRLHAVPIGVARATIRMDGHQIARVTGTTDVPIRTDSDCPSITATVGGPDGSAVWVFVADH